MGAQRDGEQVVSKCKDACKDEQGFCRGVKETTAGETAAITKPRAKPLPVVLI